MTGSGRQHSLLAAKNGTSSAVPMDAKHSFCGNAFSAFYLSLRATLFFGRQSQRRLATETLSRVIPLNRPDKLNLVSRWPPTEQCSLSIFGFNRKGW